ncbi:metallophosphoesterase domain protein [Burkholderia pseudomallei MSHR4378]|nr:metallophosphoesterase domain protein [Burkholderia pseudomallei MSHR4378]
MGAERFVGDVGRTDKACESETSGGRGRMRDAPGRAAESKAMGKAGRSSVSVAAPCDAAARCFARGGRWIAPARSNLRTAARRGTPAAAIIRRRSRCSLNAAPFETHPARRKRKARAHSRRVAHAAIADGSPVRAPRAAACLPSCVSRPPPASAWPPLPAA